MSMATVRTADSFDHWWDTEGRKKIVLFRRSLRASTSRYVYKVPSIPGVPEDLAASFPAVEMLADSYVKLVRSELAHHNRDKSTALWNGMLFGPLFAQIWATASTVPFEQIPVPASISCFKGADTRGEIQQSTWISNFANSLPDYTIKDWIAIETLETAEILAKAYLKAYAEFFISAKQSDVMVVRHHSALPAEIIGDMLNLVLMGAKKPILASLTHICISRSRSNKTMRGHPTHQRFGIDSLPRVLT